MTRKLETQGLTENKQGLNDGLITLPKVAFDRMIARMESESERDIYEEESLFINVIDAARIVREIAEEYGGDINVGEIEEYCEWGFTGDSGDWYASCEPRRVFIPVYVLDFKFCPYCGKELKVVE